LPSDRQLCCVRVLLRNDQILENLHSRKADNSAHQVKAYLADPTDIDFSTDQPILQVRIGPFNG
jgi:hypothetical protein